MWKLKMFLKYCIRPAIIFLSISQISGHIVENEDPGKPGGPCLQNLQRPCTSRFSECSDNNCQCKADHVYNSAVPTRCFKVAEIVGDSCIMDDQCTSKLGNLSDCKNYKCVCSNGAKPSEDGTQCISADIKSLIGESCSDSEECVEGSGLEKKSYCTNGGFCKCFQLDSTLISTKKLDGCLPVVNKLGGRCWEAQQCQQGIPGPLSECLVSRTGYRYCRCSGEGINDLNSQECLPKANRIGDACSFHEQCNTKLKFSHCLKDKCACLPGATFNGYQCAFQEPKPIQIIDL